MSENSQAMGRSRAYHHPTPPHLRLQEAEEPGISPLHHFLFPGPNSALLFQSVLNNPPLISPCHREGTLLPKRTPEGHIPDWLLFPWKHGLNHTKISSHQPHQETLHTQEAEWTVASFGVSTKRSTNKGTQKDNGGKWLQTSTHT